MLDNLDELEFLRKSIGKAGMLVIAPISNGMSLFEWQKEFIKK